MSRINIEGVSVGEILAWPVEFFDELVLINEPLVLNIGTAQVLGQFSVSDESRLVVELGHIDGGGEGILPTIARVARHVAQIKNILEIECIVHAVDCAEPNLKLQAHLEKTGFEIRIVPNKGEAYYKIIKVSKPRSLNSMLAIHPYKCEGLWVFDDKNVGLVQEPFVSGADTIIDSLVKDLDGADNGFTLIFSKQPFPGHHAKFDWVREESGGNWYSIESLGAEGWLCPALFKYFDDAPTNIYAQFKEKGA